jgi:hypothetical protein
MGKQTTEDRFRITGEVSVTDLGPVMAQLARIPGFSVTGSELVTEVITFKGNNRTQHDVMATDFLDNWTKEHPIFQQREALKSFKEAGRQSSAFYYAIRQLLEKGVLKKIDDDGNYTRADVRQIEPPKKEKAAAKPAITRDRHDVDHREFILRYARQHNGRFSLAKLREHFAKHKRKPSSVGGAINVLVERKSVKSLGEGEYVLLSKSAEKKPAPKKASAPKPNGADGHPDLIETTPEVLANG